MFGFPAGLTMAIDWRLVAVAGGACLLASLFAVALFHRALWARRGRNDRGRLLALALNNMTQGVAMFDAAGRLVVCNNRYLEIYGLSPDIVKPGAKLIDIVRHRFATGNVDRDPAQYCAELMDIMASGKAMSFVSELTARNPG